MRPLGVIYGFCWIEPARKQQAAWLKYWNVDYPAPQMLYVPLHHLSDLRNLFERELNQQGSSELQMRWGCLGFVLRLMRLYLMFALNC
ncbi:hypothetical protein HMPREF1602_00325 [Escherichia coli 907889]|nr:hypothetical protein HMPREF1602_00325 [Escherichia coli 907889]